MRRVITALLCASIAIGSLIAIPSTRAAADTWISSFLRDASGNLDVNMAAGAGSGAATPSYTRLQDGGGSQMASVFSGLPVDGEGVGSSNPISTASISYAYNGVAWDRIRADPNATGVVHVTTGGSATSTIATGAGNTVIKASAGRLVQLLVTTAGTASLTCYDNATTNAGTVIGITPATTTVGQVIKLDTPAANGITCAGATGSPVVTASYY